MISHVPPAQLDFVWGQVEPVIRRALRHAGGDGTTITQLKDEIRAGLLILWAVHDGPDVTAVLVLRVEKRPAKTALYVCLIAGRDFHSWAAEAQQLLQDFADLIGAESIETTVRPGLIRWLQRYGWKKKATLMEFKNG